MEHDDKNERTVYINNLSYKRDERGLKELFSKYGVVKAVKIVIDFETGQSKGMAFVEMKDAESAQRAIRGLNGRPLDGRTPKAKLATPMKNKTKPVEKIVKKAEPKKSLPKKIKKPVKRERKTSLDKMFESISSTKKKK